MSQSADDEVSEELLDEALEESFPASDPLSYWSGPDDPKAGSAAGQGGGTAQAAKGTTGRQ